MFCTGGLCYYIFIRNLFRFCDTICALKSNLNCDFMLTLKMKCFSDYIIKTVTQILLTHHNSLFILLDQLKTQQTSSAWESFILKCEIAKITVQLN